jgi:hypothetical protein
MMVAWHEMPGKGARRDPSRRDGMIEMLPCAMVHLTSLLHQQELGHHRTRMSKEEYRAFLRRHRGNLDEKYV